MWEVGSREHSQLLEYASEMGNCCSSPALLCYTGRHRTKIGVEYSKWAFCGFRVSLTSKPRLVG